MNVVYINISFFLAVSSFLCLPCIADIPFPQSANISYNEWKLYDSYLRSQRNTLLKNNHKFLSRHATNLKYSIEILPHPHLFVIYLDDAKNNISKSSHHKRVFKSIFCDLNTSYVVACCRTDHTGFKEARILKKLRHKTGVVQLKAALPTARDKITLFLEYFNAGSLACFQENNIALSSGQFIKIMHDILLGLDNVHKAGYIHRDLHMHNILIRQTATTTECALTDFGQSIPLHKKKDMSPCVPKSSCPPDVLIKGYSKVNRRQVEAYGAGVIFYTLFFGKRPDWSTVFNHWHVRKYSASHKKLLYKKCIDLHCKAESTSSSMLLDSTKLDTLKKEILWLIFKLTYPNEKNRLSIQQAIQHIQAVAHREHVIL